MKATAIVASLALATALTTAPAQAADGDFAAHAANNVGRYIASQGNAALVQIREDVKQGLLETIKPLLPEQPRKTRQSNRDKS